MYTRPRIGQLHTRVSVQRRAKAVSDGVGGSEAGPWQTLATGIPARATPLKGGEEVLASRLTGTGIWEIVLRSDSLARTLTPDDQLTLADGTVLDITYTANYDERDRYLVLTCRSGVAT